MAPTALQRALSRSDRNLPAEFDDVVARKSEEIADVRGLSLHRGEERLRFWQALDHQQTGKDFGASVDSAAANRVCLGRGNFACREWVFLPIARPTQTGQIERVQSPVNWGMPDETPPREVIPRHRAGCALPLHDRNTPPWISRSYRSPK